MGAEGVWARIGGLQELPIHSSGEGGVGGVGAVGAVRGGGGGEGGGGWARIGG